MSTTKDVSKYIKEWAYDSFDCGHIIDIDDYDEFAGICKEDGIKPSRELFSLYLLCLTEITYVH